ncbi:MAG: condensation domain-containing protein [Fuerstiella sp.]
MFYAERPDSLEAALQTTDEQPCFPLPLAPFEAYMLADHRPDYPMHFYIGMHFSGALDRERFRQALTEAIKRHPLLRARIRQRFGRSPVWESGTGVCLRECARGFDDLSEVQQAAEIDLTVETGLRTWLYAKPAEAQVLFEFHHSCCDGLGALVFLEDVLVAYDRIVRGMPTEQNAVRVSELRRRAAIPLSVGQAVRKIPLDVQDFFRILFRRPAIVAESVPSADIVDRADITSTQSEDGTQSAGGTQSQDGDGRSAVLSHRFGTAELNALLTESRAQSATLNSLLMKAVYQSLDQWMSRNGDTGHRWIRMGVPASTRADRQAATSCCNQVTIMFLDQHSREIRQGESLLTRVTEQTRFHRDSNIWYSMLQLLDFLAVVPPLLRLYLRANRRMCTTIVSNVGRAFEACTLPRTDGRLKAGDLQLTGLNFLSPLRPGTEVTFGIVTYAGTLSLNMHYKPQRIAEPEARRLFEQLVRNILDSADVPNSQR